MTNQQNGWVYLKLYPFIRSVMAVGLTARIMALRHDGIWFEVSLPVAEDAFTPSALSDVVAGAVSRLELFRTSEVKVESCHMSLSTIVRPDRSWVHIDMSPFKQDTLGFEFDGVVYPPTMNWLAQIVAKRNDGVSFYVRFPIAQDMFTPDILSVSLQNAFLTLETFRICDCNGQFKCHEHRTTEEPAS